MGVGTGKAMILPPCQRRGGVLGAELKFILPSFEGAKI
jgi:hypothetical protein